MHATAHSCVLRMRPAASGAWGCTRPANGDMRAGQVRTDGSPLLIDNDHELGRRQGFGAAPVQPSGPACSPSSVFLPGGMESWRVPGPLVVPCSTPASHQQNDLAVVLLRSPATSHAARLPARLRCRFCLLVALHLPRSAAVPLTALLASV